MSISLVAAMAKNRVIGKDNSLPWPRHSADMAHFRRLTMGKVVIMGRKTYESLPRRLEGRLNIVMSSDPLYRISETFVWKKPRLEGFISVTSVEEALYFARLFTDRSIMIIGGETVYRQFLPLAEKMFITLVDINADGDTTFPEFDPGEWRINSIDEKYADAKNPFRLMFFRLSRIST